MLIIAIKVNESDKALAAATSSTSSTKHKQQQQQLLFQVGDRGRILTAYCILTFTL